jgi:hypothetical protein
MSVAKYSVNADGVPSLIFPLPLDTIDLSKSLFCFYQLDSELKKTLLPLLDVSFSDLLDIFQYLELNPTWHTFSDLAVHLGVSRNAMIKRCLRLKLGDFPIELTCQAVRYLSEA